MGALSRSWIRTRPSCLLPRDLRLGTTPTIERKWTMTLRTWALEIRRNRKKRIRTRPWMVRPQRRTPRLRRKLRHPLRKQLSPLRFQELVCVVHRARCWLTVLVAPAKGWFGWIRRTDSTPKPVRAKLGEESAFYYDENLKKWVNKKVCIPFHH